jgi:ribonuclease HI
MMAAVLEIDIPNPSTLAYADDMNESAAALTVTSATFSLGKRFQEYSSRAAKLGLNFDPKKTELMHLSINRRYRTDTSIPLPIQTPSSLSLVRPSPQIKILGVIFDPTLSFLPHAQRASHAWWNGSPYVLNILENTYHRIARWITGLPVTTSIHKLLTCAHLPPLRILLDYLSSEYVAGVLFNPSARNLDGLLRYQPFQTKYGFYRAIDTLKPLIGRPMEQQAAEQVFSIPPIVSADRRPKDKDEAEELRKNHEAWRCRAVDNTCIVYTDGSQSADRHNGAGWYIQIKCSSGWNTVQANSCYLGQSTEVIDNEAHAVYESLEYLQAQPILPARIIICIDNSAIVSLLEYNSSRSEFIHLAQTHAMKLSTRGVKIETRWVPAHIGIGGNEDADQLAKNGSQQTLSPCPGSRLID